MDETGNVFWAMFVIAAIPAAIASFPMERRRAKRMPGTMPYTWGIYVGLSTLLLGVLMLAGGVLIGGQGGDDSVAIFLLLGIAGGVYSLAGYHAIRRSRVAFCAFWPNRPPVLIQTGHLF
jgi:hypothetical protein